ncbi:SWIM zinc finger domain-containing protein [Cytobacillus sp. FJAT-54145]|uniref:SWIM zinc finger domain-containing protein n=1 Tax=Cytobacillus spartinae TaxID=3299023 RepID=A0ABW6KDA3_9BACI
MMRISDFEEYVDKTILKRGKDYFISGSIQKVEMVKENLYIVEVVGTEFYSVKVSLTEKDDIVSTSCDCPYDWGEYCKHQVAALYALRDLRENGENQGNLDKTALKQEKDLKFILFNFNKEELLNIILDLSNEYSEIENRLLFKFSSNTDEIASSKKLIREYINGAKKRGFIEWNRVDEALEGAHMVLEKADAKVSIGDIEGAVLLSLTVLSVVVDMIQYCDDSSGFVGSVIDESFGIIDQALSIGGTQLKESQQKKLFDAVLNEANHKRYEGWSEWQLRLLGACVHLAANQKFRNKLEIQLNGMLENSSDSWSSKYETENIKLLQLELIEKFDGEERALHFINENIHLSPFRKKVLERLLKVGNYREVISICEEGEVVDKEYRGLVKIWKEYRLKAYAGLGDVKMQRELMLQFLYGSDYSYYNELKNLYPSADWPAMLEEILTTFEKERYPSSAYLEILKEERLYEKILQYCNNHLSSIQHLYPYLIEDYFEETNLLYLKFIESESANANERRKYRNVCKLIKSYKKVFGETNTALLIRKLMTLNVKRPAFIDELGKIKI